MATQSRKLTGSASALLSYFEELRLRGLEEYYSPTSRNGDRPDDDDAIVVDELWGRAAERLGITELTRAQFTDLANGRWDGEQLVGSGYRKVTDPETGEVHTERARTTTIDVVWAAPKSVAELLVATNDEELRAAVIDAMKQSVKTGFDSMEEHAAVARVPVETPTQRGPETVRHGRRAGGESKMQGSRTERVTAELLAFPVVQFSARPTDETVARGSPPDPHPHIHTPIFAVSWVPGDAEPFVARTYTPDEQGVRRQAAEREAVWMGEFARRLEDLGVPLEYHTDRKGTVTWEISGSSAEVRRLFSTNGERAHALRKEFERDKGRPPTRDELTALLDASRRRKDAEAKAVDQRGAWDRWRAVVGDAGLELMRPKLKRGGVRRKSEAVREAELWGRLFAETGLTRDDAVFTRDTLRTTVARSAIGLGFSPADLDRFEVEAATDLIAVHEARDPRFDLFTTRRMVAQELGVTAAIERKAHDVLPTPAQDAVLAAIRQSDVDLDSEQRAAVELMCSPQAWVMLQGRAGTGKTATLQAVVAAYRHRPLIGRAAADDVVVVSTAAAVAERTGRPLDADSAVSIDAYVVSITTGARTPDERTLILVDEAATVDTPRMAKLLEVAGDARIICIGDPKQAAPIGPGGWYAEAAAAHGVHELTRVYRQRDEADVRDYTKVREGAAAQALASLDERGRVHVAGDRSRAIEHALTLYRGFRDDGAAPGDIALVLDGSNREIDTVNRLVQHDRERRGEIDGPGFEVRSADTNRRWTLHTGDRIILLETREAATWREVIPPKRPPPRFVKRDQFGPILPPGPEPEYKRVARTMRNGETGVIAGIDMERNLAVVDMDRGDVVTLELSEDAQRQPLGLAYAVHVAKYQGGQTKAVIALPSRSPIASLNSGYTQLTRAELEAHVIVDFETHGDNPIDELARAWSRPQRKRTAISQLDPDAAARDRSTRGRGGTGDRSESGTSPQRPAEAWQPHAAQPHRAEPTAQTSGRPAEAPNAGVAGDSHRRSGDMRDDTPSDQTQSLYRLIISEPEAEADLWRAVEFACIRYDEESHTITRDPDAANERLRAAEALKEWWAGLVENATEMNNTRLLGVLEQYDAESVDWLALAEQVLGHDGRGDRRTWDHEIPYDPFTRWVDPDLVWRLRDRDTRRDAAAHDRASTVSDTGVAGESQVAEWETNEALLSPTDLHDLPEEGRRAHTSGAAENGHRADRIPQVTDARTRLAQIRKQLRDLAFRTSRAQHVAKDEAAIHLQRSLLAQELKWLEQQRPPPSQDHSAGRSGP